MDYTVHGILQARILEWVVFSFSRGPSQPRDRTQVSHIAGRFFASWATRLSGYSIKSILNLTIYLALSMWCMCVCIIFVLGLHCTRPTVLDLCCFSLVVMNGGYSLVVMRGLLLLWSMGFRVHRLSSCSSWTLGCVGSIVVVNGLSCPMARGISADQGWRPCLLHWQVDSLPLSIQGSLYMCDEYFHKLTLEVSILSY